MEKFKCSIICEWTCIRLRTGSGAYHCGRGPACQALFTPRQAVHLGKQINFFNNTSIFSHICVDWIFTAAKCKEVKQEREIISQQMLLPAGQLPVGDNCSQGSSVWRARHVHRQNIMSSTDSLTGTLQTLPTSPEKTALYSQVPTEKPFHYT